MRNAKIIGSGMYVPKKVIPNSYFNEILQEDVDTWLRENVQIHERRWCAENESTADLCVNAANEILKNANVNVEDLDLIIIATDTPEYISPSTASVVQYRLGAVNAGTFDLNSACSGFVNALDVAAKYIQADKNYKYILVLGAYAMSKHLNKTDKKTVTLFADGASGVILKSDDSGSGMLASQLKTKGEYSGWMGIYGGGTFSPTTEETLKKGDHQLRFVKKFPKELNSIIWSTMIKDLCKSIELTPQDIDHYFITQININSIKETLDILGVGMDKTTTIMHNYGYTGSACIPMAYHQAIQNNKIKEGDTVLFIGSGGGLAFAGAIFKL